LIWSKSRISEYAAISTTKMPIRTPSGMPNSVTPSRPNALWVTPVNISTMLTSENAMYPTIATRKNRVSFGVARTLPDENSSSVTAKTPRVPNTACVTMPSHIVLYMFEMPPTNRPSKKAYASTSAGDGFFLKVFTRARTNPTIAPTIQTTGGRFQPATEPTMSTPNARSVLTIVSSYDIRPVSTLSAEGRSYMSRSWSGDMPGCCGA